MAGGRFSVLSDDFFQVGINIRPTKHGVWVGWAGGGWDGRGVGREEAKPP